MTDAEKYSNESRARKSTTPAWLLEAFNGRAGAAEGLVPPALSGSIPEPSTTLTAVERLRNGGQPDLADQVDSEIREAHAAGRRAVMEDLERIGAVADCPGCGGRGERMMGFMNGPDAYQEVVDCPDCNGTGYARVRPA